MPYIIHSRRVIIKPYVRALAARIHDKSSLNYAITRLAHLYVARRGLGYDSLSDVEGTLQCVSKEFYRTVVAPYEDKKRLEHGSVSSLDKPPAFWGDLSDE